MRRKLPKEKNQKEKMHETYCEEQFNDIRSVSDARNLFPITEKCVYLDSAHFTHYSLETRRRILKFLDEFTYTEKKLNIISEETIKRIKYKISKFIKSEPHEIILTSNTTHGLNIFANGINLKKGDVVAFSDSEFPAVIYPWFNQKNIRGLEYKMIKSFQGKINISDIESVIKNFDVKVLTISHVGFLGFRNNLEDISKICSKYECYLVIDAIQSIGACPITVNELKVDFLSAGAQKWMMAPAGIGFAYMPYRMRDQISPTYVGTTSINYDFENFLDYRMKFKSDGSAYENSTLNILGIIGLEASIDLFLKLGVSRIYNHIINLQDLLIKYLLESDYEVVSDMSEDHRSNILLISHRDFKKNKRIQKKLESKKIYIALREGYLRVSPHLFNNDNDIIMLSETMLSLQKE